MLNWLPNWIKRRLRDFGFRIFYKIKTWDRAANCYRKLLELLRAADNPHDAQLRADLEAGRWFYEKLLNQEPAACRVIENLESTTRGQGPATQAEDVFFDCKVAQMLCSLAELSRSHGVPERFLGGFESAISGLVQRFLLHSENQIDVVCRSLLQLKKAILQRASEDARVFLLELPVGNSLLVQCLGQLLQGDAEGRIVRASLSRNTSEDAGVRREDLLKEHIEAAGLRPGDVVVYMDEWISGSNFNAIGEVIQDLLPSGVLFWPVAFLAHSALNDSHFQKFVKAHDKWTQAVIGCESRFSLPELVNGTNPKVPFFWSENDRLAGYRKLQIHGSLFSTLFHVAELLHADKEKFDEAATALLAQGGGSLPNTLPRTLAGMREVYEEDYPLFVADRDALQKSAEHLARGDLFVDLKASIQEIVDGYGRILDDQPAARVMCIAGCYQNILGSLEPVDRFPLKPHVPTLQILTGIANLPHREALAYLLERCRVLETIE